MQVTFHDSIQEIPASEWNALVQNQQPFLQHCFIAALENHGCIGGELDWYGHHICVREDGQLIGAMPLFEKHNTHGEFVFDHSWADAWHRAGLQYYPKLVSATPYTPASGQRLLVTQGRETDVYPILLEAVIQFTIASEASSFHCLFPAQEQQEFMSDAGLFTRHDCQYHWHNHNYQSFDDFLSTLTSKKRKNIKQERRKVKDAGITLRVLNGETASAEDWAVFTEFYRRIYERKWGMPVFNQPFFCEVAAALGEQVILVIAELEDKPIAGSLMYKSEHTLFGRHWGCAEKYDSLHFEACYYQGIEYCIKHGLKLFEPGAQGEHKVARGFIPTITKSCHWIAAEGFRPSIERFCEHEKQSIEAYMEQLQDRLPYKTK